MPINVIKIGGNVIDDERKLQDFLRLFARLSGEKILVHGGGKIATTIAKKLDVETKMLEGRRLTDAPMRDVVTMVYGGLLNKRIVAGLQSLDCNAIGLSGADGATILAKKRPVSMVDYGYVGDIEKVNTAFIQSLLERNMSPVFAPLTFNKEHGILNTNADTMASAIGTSLAESRIVNLIYCFEKKGVLADPEDEDSVISLLKPGNYDKHKSDGTIYEGMIPKLDNAFEAVKKGVKKVIICRADEILNAIEKGKSGTQISL